MCWTMKSIRLEIYWKLPPQKSCFIPSFPNIYHWTHESSFFVNIIREAWSQGRIRNGICKLYILCISWMQLKLESCAWKTRLPSGGIVNMNVGRGYECGLLGTWYGDAAAEAGVRRAAVSSCLQLPLTSTSCYQPHNFLLLLILCCLVSSDRYVYQREVMV